MSEFNIDAISIKKLAQMLNKENLAEIEIGQGEDYVRITRTQAGGSIVTAPAPVASPALVTTPIPVATDTTADTPSKDYSDAVKSPIVGTAYYSSSPDAQPFVQIGDTVNKGDTVMIVEAMKVMNNITAHKNGIVKEILVSDSQPVEFEQPLLIIE